MGGINGCFKVPYSDWIDLGEYKNEDRKASRREKEDLTRWIDVDDVGEDGWVVGLDLPRWDVL